MFRRTGWNDISGFTQPFDASTISTRCNTASNVNVYGSVIIGAKRASRISTSFAQQDV